MTPLKLNLMQYERWAQETWKTYASTSVPETPESPFRYRLGFKVSMNGHFWITFGSKTLYKGDDLKKALEIFNKNSG